MKIVTPEEAGFSSARLQRLNSAMQGYVDQNILVGLSTLVARRGRVFHFECFGQMDREAGKPIQRDTIFRIYSMTKPITSVAMMMLYEEGRFMLSDPVSKYIPGFKNVKVIVESSGNDFGLTDLDRQITIHDLMTHTAGLGYGLFEDSPVEDLYREANVLGSALSMAKSLEEVVQLLTELPLAHQPGSRFRYSMATDVLGYLVGLISGMPFDDFLKERILDPLGMVDTAFYVPPEKIDRFAAMYGPTEKSKLDLLDAPASSRFTSPDYNPSGGGGLVSTSTDYMRFAQMLLNGGELDGTRLLGRKTVELMTMNHLPHELIPIHVGTNPVSGFGFGLGVRVLVNPAQFGVLGSTGEYGWAGAASTYFWIDPQEELIGMIMPQFMSSFLLPVPIRELFRNLVYQALVN